MVSLFFYTLVWQKKKREKGTNGYRMMLTGLFHQQKNHMKRLKNIFTRYEGN